MASIAGEKPHALCFPYPAQGHMNGMLRLAKLLHTKGFHITFVLTEFNHARILRSRGPTALQGLPDFNFETISDGLPPSDNQESSQHTPSLCLAIRKCSAPLLELVSKLNDPLSPVPPVSCIISDTITSCTLDVAAEIGVPDVIFSSAGAAGFMGIVQFENLIQRGILPLKDKSDLSNGYLDTPVDWIPGMKNMRLKDLPTLMRITNIDEVVFKFILDEVTDCYRARAIIINTFDDLEGPVIDALSSTMHLPVYAIGPLNMLSDHHDSPHISMGLNLWREDEGCLNWLEGREAGSVVYVNFGSSAAITNEQLIEFAWGLANSGYDFLWVIRPDLVMGDSAVLPEELLKEISRKSLLASWCPQDAVLSHPAVGGFLTHCGWNSTLESLGAGVPMVCWPFFADQQTNCRYLCVEWGVGMEIDNKVRREEVEALLRELMDGEKGKEMKRRAGEWKESAIKATQPGGRSVVNIDKVIHEVLLGKTSF